MAPVITRVVGSAGQAQGTGPRETPLLNSPSPPPSVIPYCASPDPKNGQTSEGGAERMPMVKMVMTVKSCGTRGSCQC